MKKLTSTILALSMITIAIIGMTACNRQTGRHRVENMLELMETLTINIHEAIPPGDGRAAHRPPPSDFEEFDSRARNRFITWIGIVTVVGHENVLIPHDNNIDTHPPVVGNISRSSHTITELHVEEQFFYGQNISSYDIGSVIRVREFYFIYDDEIFLRWNIPLMPGEQYIIYLSLSRIDGHDSDGSVYHAIPMDDRDGNRAHQRFSDYLYQAEMEIIDSDDCFSCCTPRSRVARDRQTMRELTTHGFIAQGAREKYLR